MTFLSVRSLLSPSPPRDDGFGDALVLIAVSGGDAFRSRGEEVCIALAGEGEQTLLGGRVRLDPAAAQNVGDVIAALGEASADEEATMAGQRLVLGAHQRRPSARRHFLDTSEALGEHPACRHLLVIWDVSFGGAAAEFEAKEHVSDPDGVEALLQRGPVEVRQPRRRVRSHVDDDADTGRVKQKNEGGPVMRRVSNTINCLQCLYLPLFDPTIIDCDGICT
jgi:hypothetical protein